MVGNIGLAKIPGVQHGEMADTSRFYEDWAIVEWEHTGCNHLLEVPLILDDEMRMKLFNSCKTNFISWINLLLYKYNQSIFFTIQ